MQKNAQLRKKSFKVATKKLPNNPLRRILRKTHLTSKASSIPRKLFQPRAPQKMKKIQKQKRSKLFQRSDKKNIELL